MYPSIKGFDQVVALTQEVINTGFNGLWTKANHSPVQRIGDHEVTLKNVLFDAPRIIIPDNHNLATRSKILFVLRIKKGRFLYYKHEDDDDQTEVCADGWAFAIPCDMELQDITDPNELKQKRMDLNIPGDYSVTRLIVSLRNAATGSIDKSMSHWTIDVSDQLMQSLAGFICKTDKGALDKDLATLGYISMTNQPNDANSHIATFKPIAMSYETSSWFDPSTGTTAGTGTNGNSILNYLLYKETTQGNTVPTGNDSWLYPTASWTPGSASDTNDDSKMVLGRFVLSGRQFFDNWLIPKISIFNDLVHVSASEQTCGAWADSSYQWGCKLQLCDMPGGSDPKYWIPKKTGPRSWSFESDFNLPRRDEHSLATIACSGTVNITNRSTITIDANSNRIVVKGETDINLYTEVWRGIKDHAFSKADRVGRRLTYTIYIDLVAVKDGGLSVNMTVDDTQYTKSNDQNDLNYLGSYRSGLDNHIPGMVDQFKRVEGELAQDLNGLHKLYFPAGGIFYYDNPMVNENGDVICDVRYKSAATDFPGPTRSLLGEGIEKKTQMMGIPEKAIMPRQ